MCKPLGGGVHEASRTLAAPSAPAGAQASASVKVRVVINLASPVQVATWKDGRKGAFSSSPDVSQTAGYSESTASGVDGSFMVQGDAAPADYARMPADAIEIGSHLVAHTCSTYSLEWEIEDSVDAAVLATGSLDDIWSLVWPCGFRNIEYGAIAAKCSLLARGYNTNQLEDATPRDFMNLKSLNSHEHPPLPPADLKSIADDAEPQGEWAKMGPASGLGVPPDVGDLWGGSNDTHNTAARGWANWTCEPSRIGTGAAIGSSATILPGLEIGGYTVIGAEAIASKDIPPGNSAIGRDEILAYWRADGQAASHE